MQITRLTRRIGAVAHDVRLATVEGDELAELVAAVHEHGVVLLPGQHLTPEEQLDFTARLGELFVYPVARLFGSTNALGRIEDTADSPPDADNWHTDITWVAEPPLYAVLAAQVIPAYGGDTMWCSLEAAYDALSPAMQRICEGLEAFHSQGPKFGQVMRRLYGDDTAAKIEAAFPGATHPLVRTHPVTGRRSLFLSSFLQHLVGLTPEESRHLLSYLWRLLDDPNLQVRWRWTPGDVAIWDEANTNHRALADHYPQHRVMHRTTAGCARPVFDAGEAATGAQVPCD